MNRRKFLLSSAAVAAPLFVPRDLFARPSNEVRLGFIGAGRRAKQIVGSFEGAKVVTVCDVFYPRAQSLAAKLGAESQLDYRAVLDRKDVDAVVIATPDHWHALQAIYACQAGKDVYCEKPLALTVVEGRAMVDAARKHHRVFAVGTQQRSLKPNRIACRAVRGGALGKVKKVTVANYPGPSGQWFDREDVPEALDWNEWLGQAPDELPYNNAYLFPENEPGWTSKYAFAGGEMTGWGAHGFDMVRWALGMEPVEVGSWGARADDSPVWWKFPDGVYMNTHKAPKAGCWISCDYGEIHIDRNRFHILPEELGHELLKDVDLTETPEETHMKNFVDCVRSRKRPHADVEDGQRSVTIGHLGNIARWVGGRMGWDASTERFSCGCANRHLGRNRRKGYELPSI